MLTNPVPSLTISFALISGCTKRIPDFGLWDFTLLYTGWQYKKLIMNRKFQQWWLTIPTISAKRAITSHVKPLNSRKTPAYFVDIWHCELQFVKGSHKSQFVKCLFLHFPLLSLTDKILIRSLIWKRMAIIVEFQTWSEIMIAQVVTKKVNYIEDTLCRSKHSKKMELFILQKCTRSDNSNWSKFKLYFISCICTQWCEIKQIRTVTDL